LEIKRLKFFLEKKKMGTVKMAYGISGEVEVVFGRLMRYKFDCLGWISFSPKHLLI